MGPLTLIPDWVLGTVGLAGNREPHHCSFCGSILDPPRTNPLTRSPGRKCLSCNEWRSVAAPREPKRNE